MHNLQNYLLLSDFLDAEKNLVPVINGLVSNYSPVFHKEHFCFYHGIIHNASTLTSSTEPHLGSFEAVLIEHFLLDKHKFPSLLSGNFSLVIGNNKDLYLYRDPNGYENLYFSINSSGKGGILISNTIKEIAGYYKLEVNTDILPEYFIKTDINSGETFFKNIKTLAFFEFAKINYHSGILEKGFFDTFFTVSRSISKIKIKDIIEEFDNLFGHVIDMKFNQLNSNYKIINALSGGTDSSFIQYYLKKNHSDIAYTANYLKAGMDHSYASDVAGFLNLKHKTVHSNIDYLIDCLPTAILHSEKPFVFSGESLLLHMYEEIGKDFTTPVVCFDGAGSEGILGASRLLFELRIIRKYRLAFIFILPFIKLFSKKTYNRFNEFFTYVNRHTIPDNFILRYFTDEQIWETVKTSFKLPDLNHIDDFEMSMMKNYNTTFFEAVYRFLSFELEYKRVNNVRTQLAKKNNIYLVFPYTETSLFKYLIYFDTEIKLRRAKTKYIFRKAMEKKFPKYIVYRKKIKKNVSVSDDILKNEKIQEIIEEIKNKNYPYFNFNYDEVFSLTKLSSIAYKLINFHIWHKLFIDGDTFE